MLVALIVTLCLLLELDWLKQVIFFMLWSIMDIYEEVGKPLQGRAIYVTIGLPYFF